MIPQCIASLNRPVTAGVDSECDLASCPEIIKSVVSREDPIERNDEKGEVQSQEMVEAALLLSSIKKDQIPGIHDSSINEDQPSPCQNQFSHLCCLFESEYEHQFESELQKSNLNSSNSSSRIRTVSISCPSEITTSLSYPSSSDENNTNDNNHYAHSSVAVAISPPNSPRLAAIVKWDDSSPSTPILSGRKRNHVAIVSPVDSSNSNKRLELPPMVSSCHRDNRKIKTILRRKFSWKNYPELEAFLIANRSEYLRHSALNYTTQQKQYNNLLTERLLELASKHGYQFDSEAFSFVTVRDRIRCYYKSYVQSSKKRGVVVGYAARKAGLLSAKELENSAGKIGRIVIPQL